MRESVDISVNKQEVIVISVCTYNRPNMLTECLRSLIRQDYPDNITVRFCIIDNNSNYEYNIESLVKKELQGYDYKYIFVKERGISYARNAALDYAKLIKADFIEFLDDDEIADKECTKSLYKTIKTTNADVVQGNIIFNFPANVNKLFHQELEIKRSEGVTLKYVATSNVLFRRKLIEDWGLRFHEKLALIGGEDIDFFLKSSANGGKHIFTNTSIVFETFPVERSTLKWQLTRKLRDGFTMSYVTYLNHGYLAFVRKYLIKSVRTLLVQPFILFFYTLTANKQKQFKYLQRISHALGCVAFALRINIYGYKKITGL